jgi:uncharacterized integral membrane protein
VSPRSSDPADHEPPELDGRDHPTSGDGPAPERPAERRSDADRGSSGPAPGTSTGRDGSTASSPAAASREPVPFTQILGRITLVVLAVLFGVFAVANSQPVAFSWVFGATEVRAAPGGDGELGGVPLIILLVGSFVIGAAVGMLLEWQLLRGRRRRRET